MNAPMIALSPAGVAGAVGPFLPVWLQTRIGRAMPSLLGGASMFGGLAGLLWMIDASDETGFCFPPARSASVGTLSTRTNQGCCWPWVATAVQS